MESACDLRGAEEKSLAGNVGPSITSEEERMSTFVRRSWRELLAMGVALALTAALLLSAQADARAVVAAKNVVGFEIDTETNASQAVAGGTGTVIVSMLVTNSRTQKPVTGLSNSIAPNAAGITLPSKVFLTDVTVAPGGCKVTPTAFNNHGRGVYSISMVPFVGNVACKWIAGDYVFIIQVKNGAGSVVASGLAKISVP